MAHVRLLQNCLITVHSCSADVAPFGLPTWLKTEWSYRNQWSASVDTSINATRGTHGGAPALARYLLGNRRWAQIGQETCKADAARLGQIRIGETFHVGQSSVLGYWRVQAAVFSVQRFISGTRCDAAETTWWQVEACSDTTLLVAKGRSHGTRGAEMRCWS